MKAEEILAQARDMLTVRTVFGEPYQQDGTLVVPVARVRGLGGGGGGEGSGSGGTGGGGGGGFVMHAIPVGCYVIRDGNVSWRPAVDVNRTIQAGVIAGSIVLRGLLRRRRRRVR